jgi:uncharacterized protein YraI
VARGGGTDGEQRAWKQGVEAQGPTSLLGRLMMQGARKWLTATAVLFALSAVLASAVAASETAYAQGAVTVYSSPTVAAPVLVELQPGDSVTAHGAEGDWVNVDVDIAGQMTNGWVQQGALGPAAP